MKKTGPSVPAATVRFVEYVVADSLRDTCRLKAAFRAAKNGWKLDYKYTGGYSTEQEAFGEADLFSYAVQKDLARHWGEVAAQILANMSNTLTNLQTQLYRAQHQPPNV